jgi:hypothetical protein
MYFSTLHNAVGLDTFVDQSSSSSPCGGRKQEYEEEVDEERVGDSRMGIKRDLERAESGVRRPRSCSAVCGADRVARRG